MTFDKLGARQTQILELAAIIGVSQHYAASGFQIDIRNPLAGSQFIVKTSTRGHPASYSRICCSSGSETVELHSNLVVRGAHDEGMYCVDVGIIESGCVPYTKTKTKWECVRNEDLRSFAEVKKLVVYPMLLAQFLGIVHEIRPNFLDEPPPLGFGIGAHLPPTLISLGHFSGNSRIIVKGFLRRGFSFLVSANFDMRLAWSRQDSSRSPFYGTLEDDGLNSY